MLPPVYFLFRTDLSNHCQCSIHGVCNDILEDGNYACQCDDGWYGDACDISTSISITNVLDNDLS
jgi:hypothetical protein